MGPETASLTGCKHMLLLQEMRSPEELDLWPGVGVVFGFLKSRGILTKSDGGCNGFSVVKKETWRCQEIV